MKAIIWAVLLTALIAVSAIIGGVGVAHAAVAEYTDVIEDLRRDKDFDLSEYPENLYQYDLEVIQIAESKSGELFVYTYQPFQRLHRLNATGVNMSLSETLDGTKIYPLTLLNENGTLCKYKVNGLTVGSEAVRYYNVTSIYRPFDRVVDLDTGNDNTISEVACRVGKCWRVSQESGELKYECKKTEVITVTSKYVGFLRYFNGFHLSSYSQCDSHFVAFSCDYQIDELYSVDVEYESESVKSGWKMFVGDYVERGERETTFVTLDSETEAGNETNGFLGVKHTWKEIERVDEFIASNDLTSECKENLRGKQWILRFVHTEFYTYNSSVENFFRYTDVNNVTILRLKFETAGKVYNLGAVDNKQSGDQIPDNNDEMGKSLIDILCEWLESVTGVPAIVWKILIYALPFIILLPILSVFLPPFGRAMIFILKVVWRVVTFPFLCLWWLIKKLFTKRESAGTSTVGKTSKSKAEKKGNERNT